MSNQQNDHITEALYETIDDLKQALHCYAINFPCPGFEVGPGAGQTSGCSMQGNDCPICQIRERNKI